MLVARTNALVSADDTALIEPPAATQALPVRPPTNQRAWLQRLADVAVASVLLIVLLPVLIAALIGSALAFRAWPLFVQDRVGLHGTRLRFVKVRTLPPTTNAYADKYALAKVQIPRFGQILRRLHIDEIPQLLLVVLGKMSLVGPRPEMPALHANFPAAFGALRTSVRPGCTGLWQISEASDRLITEAPEFDELYVRASCLRLDAWIVAQTVRKILRGGHGTLTVDDLPAWAVAASDLGPVALREPIQVIDLRDDRPAHSPLVYETTTRVAAVVITHGPHPDLRDCLAALDPQVDELIVIANLPEPLGGLPARARLIQNDRPLGFAANANLGIAATNASYVIVANPDAVASPGAVARLVDHLEKHPQAGLAGPEMRYPDGTWQPSRRRFPTVLGTVVRRTPLRRLPGATRLQRSHYLLDERPNEAVQADWLLGGFLCLRRSMLDQLGGFDERYRLYCEDIDLGYAARQAGWERWYVPAAVVTHRYAAEIDKRFLTIRTLWHLTGMLRFVRKHPERLLALF